MLGTNCGYKKDFLVGLEEFFAKTVKRLRKSLLPVLLTDPEHARGFTYPICVWPGIPWEELEDVADQE